MGIIINADDYGMNERCSEAIARAFHEGLITDTTMMATGEYFDRAVILAKEQGFKDKIGIHFNLTEGEPLTEEIKKCSRFVTEGRLTRQYNRISPLTKREKSAIYHELSAQVEKLESSGINITHADSHHHIHTGFFIAPIVTKVCKEHGINKVRLNRNLGKISFIKSFIKNKYNRWLQKQGFVTTEFFAFSKDVADTYIPDNTEVMVHPDFDENGVLIDRRGFKDGIPFGKRIPNLRTGQNFILKNYSSL